MRKPFVPMTLEMLHPTTGKLVDVEVRSLVEIEPISGDRSRVVSHDWPDISFEVGKSKEDFLATLRRVWPDLPRWNDDDAS